MLNDIANKLREKGITKQANPQEFETQRIARAEEIINNFAQSIKKSVKNAQFFLYNPRSPTDKAYNYKFTYADDGSVSVKILPEKTENSFKLNEIVPVEEFLGHMINYVVPQFHQIQFFQYAKEFCQRHHADTVTKSLNENSLNQALQVIDEEITRFETEASEASKKHITEVIPQVIIPKVSELASKFIEESKAENYFLANTFHKQLSTKVYSDMKKEIKELEAYLYKETILPRERKLNERYQIFVKQVVVNNTQLIDQLQNEQVLQRLSKKIEGTRIKKSLLNPNNYIWMKDGQVRDFEQKIQDTIKRMLNHNEVQGDFDSFIKNVSDTYRKLAKLVITEIVVRRNSSETEKLEIISKIYNVNFAEALAVLDKWTEYINTIPLVQQKGGMGSI